MFKNGMIALGMLAWMAVPFSAAWAEKAKTDAKEEKVPLNLTLPKPMFVGTPEDVRSKNLEKSSGKKRPTFMVPKGVTNLVAGRLVTSSDKEPIVGTMEQLTDGDKEGVDGSYVELGPGLQWVQIDLGKKASIYAILLWHFHAQPRVYHDVIVKTSDDPDFITALKAIFRLRFEFTGFHAVEDLARLFVGDGCGLFATAQKSGHLGRVVDGMPGLVIKLHFNKDVPRIELTR